MSGCGRCGVSVRKDGPVIAAMRESMLASAEYAALLWLDSLVDSIRESHPDHSLEWYDAYLLRFRHYAKHKGDMTGAPQLPGGHSCGEPNEHGFIVGNDS